MPLSNVSTMQAASSILHGYYFREHIDWLIPSLTLFVLGNNRSMAAICWPDVFWGSLQTG